MDVGVSGDVVGAGEVKVGEHNLNRNGNSKYTYTRVTTKVVGEDDKRNQKVCICVYVLRRDVDKDMIGMFSQ